MPLTRERVLATALAVADAEGLAAVTMRRLGAELSIEAMSLYHHVVNKSALLDGMVDAVFAEVAPPAGAYWKAALRRHYASLRAVLAAHSWAIPLLDSRASPGLATLARLDAVLGVLRTAGFTIPLAAHAIAALDAYVYGFAVQEAGLRQVPVPDVARETAAGLDEGAFPHLVELAREHVAQPGYSFAAEFDWGLDLVLDGLGTHLT
ncbi:TetR/AcrR family transcriptional regulator C-terminal domain-containing protein [Pseudonocardia oroxyli]|uniref:Transcriptional regulator, TetR family n=1 Tax=Pseudonocardia oroxyli TaxID=366584 RepID=A0A1G7LF90_PSEOR|nr:TetR/AcrR family transcriptional regulator C-terminal domain-containing protein [Pseudonocardia oroxyli]SDF47629.1 transcriptional regulator, TetR family [Pseudonocardia oroxyli]